MVVCTSRVASAAVLLASLIAAGCTDAIKPQVTGRGGTVVDPSHCNPQSSDEGMLRESHLGCHTGMAGAGRQVELSYVKRNPDPNIVDSDSEVRVSIYIPQTAEGNVPFDAYYSNGVEGFFIPAGCDGGKTAGRVSVDRVPNGTRVVYDIEFKLHASRGDKCPDTKRIRGSEIVESFN